MAKVSSTAKNNKQNWSYLFLGGAFAIAIIMAIVIFTGGFQSRSESDPNFDNVHVNEGTVYYDTTGLVTVLSFGGEGLSYNYGNNTVAQFLKFYEIKTKMIVRIDEDQLSDVSVDCPDSDGCMLFLPIAGPHTVSSELFDAMLQVGHPELDYEDRSAKAIGVVYAIAGKDYSDYVDEIEFQCVEFDTCVQISKSEFEEMQKRFSGMSLPLEVYKNGKLFNPQ